MNAYRFARSMIVAAGCAVAPLAAAAGFVDVLDSPAQMTPLATKSLMQAVARAGNRLVTVGQRGHILVSSDGGASWKQSPVPVSSDLTALYFVDDSKGWAVGHDGVVLHTDDGGATWNLQFDGRKANEVLVAALQRRADAEASSDAAKKLLAEAMRYRDQGADKPFLDVWFDDADNGWIVGAFNLIFRTSDGGKSWRPWFDRIDNPKFLNLYAVRRIGRELYVAGEAGLLLKLDPAAERFRALDAGYSGSFFGLADARGAVLAFGLRGSVFRSDDAGKSWTKIDVGLPAAVVASAHSAHDATLLGDAGGRLVASGDGGRTFRKVALKQSSPLTGFAEIAGGGVAITGPRGVLITEMTGP